MYDLSKIEVLDPPHSFYTFGKIVVLLLGNNQKYFFST